VCFILLGLLIASSVNACYIISEKQIFFGEKIKFKIKTKDPVEYWIEDFEGNTVKNKKNTSNSNWKSYTAKAKTTKVYKIKTNWCNSSEALVVFIPNSTEEVEVEDGFEYQLRYVPSIVYTGQEFPIIIDFINNYNKSINISVWSYVYRGSKRYSGERKENQRNLTLNKHSQMLVELENLVTAVDGDYSLRISIERDNKKKNIKKQIVVMSKPAIDVSSLKYDSSKGTVEIEIENNNYNNLTLVLETSSEYFKEVLFLNQGENFVTKKIKLLSGKNHIYVKLLKEDKIVTIKELIVSKKHTDKPFNLVQGSVMLNSSRTVFKDPNQKLKGLIPWIILFLSLLINLNNFRKLFGKST